MTKDSTKLLSQEIPAKKMKSPRISTINFIRQFSRAYVTLAGASAINGIICN